jgi:hypothetical protein
MNRVYARHATVYPSTETLTNRGFNRMINKMMQQLFLETQTLFTETLPLSDCRALFKKNGFVQYSFSKVLRLWRKPSSDWSLRNCSLSSTVNY